jgi:hypothetical protein
MEPNTSESKEEQKESLKEEKEEKETTEEESSESEETEEEEESEEEDLSAEDTARAKAIFRSLKDPNLAPSIITAMAKEAGILGDHTKDVAKSIQDKVSERLGSEYAFLAPKLIPAIQVLVDEEMKKVDAKLEQAQMKQVEREIDDALENINRITKGDAKKYHQKMAKLLEEMPPSGKVPIGKHLMRLYTIAKQDEARVSNKIEKAKRAQSNANDLGSRASAAGGLSGTARTGGKISLDQAIELAMDKLEKK